MMQPHLRNKRYIQMCWVVPDLEASIRHWVKSAGAGPFFVFDELHFEDGMYRGKPSDVQPCRAAIGQLDDMQIELVVPNDAGPGLWTDVVPKGQLGFHHVGLYCTDYEADKAAYMFSGDSPNALAEMQSMAVLLPLKTSAVASPTLAAFAETALIR